MVMVRVRVRVTNLVHRPIRGLGGGRGGGGCWALAEPPKDTLGLRLAKGVEDVERACVCEGEGEGKGGA